MNIKHGTASAEEIHAQQSVNKRFCRESVSDNGEIVDLGPKTIEAGNFHHWRHKDPIRSNDPHCPERMVGVAANSFYRLNREDRETGPGIDQEAEHDSLMSPPDYGYTNAEQRPISRERVGLARVHKATAWSVGSSPVYSILSDLPEALRRRR